MRHRSARISEKVVSAAPPEAAPRNEILAVAGVMLPSGFAGLFGFLSMKKAMEYGYHAIGWCIVQSAMLCPFLAGMLWFGDRVTLWRTGGMVLLTASLILLGAAAALTYCFRKKKA